MIQRNNELPIHPLDPMSSTLSVLAFSTESSTKSVTNTHVSLPVNALGSEFGSGGSNGGPGVSISEITGQQSASSNGNVASAAASRTVPTAATAAAAVGSSAVGADPPSETGSTGSGQLLSLEPPLASSDYSFSLDDQENLNDLFELF